MAYQLRYNIRSNVHRSDELFCLCTNPENDGGTYRDYGIITQVQPSEAMLSLGSVWNNTISIRKPTLSLECASFPETDSKAKETTEEKSHTVKRAKNPMRRQAEPCKNFLIAF